MSFYHRISSVPMGGGGDLCAENRWQYHQRREMQEIIPNLYLGPLASVVKTKKDSLIQIGVTHIVCVRHAQETQFIRPLFPETFKYLVLEIEETEEQSIIQYFQTLKDFVDTALLHGGKVLIHGNTGICRSAALTVAYVMARQQMSFYDAFKLVQAKRLCIDLGENFCAQLSEYEPILRSLNSMATPSMGNGNDINIHHKRGFVETPDLPVPSQAYINFEENDDTGNQMDFS